MNTSTGLLLTVLATWLSTDALAGPKGHVGVPVTPGPCDGGGWGEITVNPALSLHVRVTGDDVAGDGTEANPFATVGRALAASRLLPQDRRKIAVGPGEFDANLTIDQLADDGLILQGCGIEDTTLDADDDALPVIDLATNAEFEVGGFTIEDGTNSLTIRDGAVAWVHDVFVSKPEVTGIVVTDFETLAALEDVSVDKSKEASGCGWGVSVTDAMVLWRGGTVEDTRGLGIFADGADLIVDGVSVLDTKSADDGTLGRGLHAQESWTLLMESTFSQNNDAGVFLLHPLGGLVARIIIDLPGAGIVAPGGLPTTGDGLVIKGQADGRFVTLLENTVEDAARAAMILQDIRASVGGNIWMNTGVFPLLGADALRQGITSLIGPDSATVLDISANPEPINDAYVTCVP